jgi:hypothetical protein
MQRHYLGRFDYIREASTPSTHAHIVLIVTMAGCSKRKVVARSRERSRKKIGFCPRQEFVRATSSPPIRSNELIADLPCFKIFSKRKKKFSIFRRFCENKVFPMTSWCYWQCHAGIASVICEKHSGTTSVIREIHRRKTQWHRISHLWTTQRHLHLVGIFIRRRLLVL